MTNPTTTSRTIAEEPPERVILSGRAVAQLVDLLDHCYAFLDGNPDVQAELREYCLPKPYGVTTFWVIDQLAWHALLLRVHSLSKPPKTGVADPLSRAEAASGVVGRDRC